MYMADPGVEPCAGRAAPPTFVLRRRFSKTGAPPPPTFGRRAADVPAITCIFWHAFLSSNILTRIGQLKSLRAIA